MPQQSLLLEPFFHPEQAGSYILLPFDLPDEVIRLEVQYEYSHPISAEPEYSGGNTLDLGIFDARGAHFLDAGFRGWSGSERPSFFITETEATPGYLAGAMLPGRWNILLGLYKLAPEGCSARLVIHITTVPGHRSQAALPTPVAGLPASAVNPLFSPWLRGEMHCHTWHSDGENSPLEVAQLARSRGLDFITITDHNTISSQRELASLSVPGLILLRGIEVTTFRGHFNAWGCGDWVDFRVESPEMMQAALDYARAHGALTVCNHPKPQGPPWEYPQVNNYDCIEVWNGPWNDLNQVSFEFWLKQLAEGRRIPAVGGSDYHSRRHSAGTMPRLPGCPTLWAYLPGVPDETTILQSIRAGHVSLSDTPLGALLELRAGPNLTALSGDSLPRAREQIAVQLRCRRGEGNWLRLWDQQKCLFEQKIVLEDETVTLELPAADSLFVRADLHAPNGEMKALTNPVYIDS